MNETYLRRYEAEVDELEEAARRRRVAVRMSELRTTYTHNARIVRIPKPTTPWK